MQLNLGNAVLRFFPDYDDAERKRLLGTLIMFWFAWSVFMMIVLNVAGPFLFDGLFRNVRFEPYLRLGTWLALVNTIPALPLVALQMQERPVAYRALTFASFLLTTGLMLLFVVGFHMGALGSLLGQALGGALMAIPFLWVLRHNVQWRIHGPTLKMGLLFSLPLLIYTIGGWAMDTSNRIFIERFTSLNELGLFNVATQLAAIVALALTAVGLAYTPLFYETAKLPDGPALLARFGQFYLAGTLALGLGVSIFSREMVQVMTQPAFHSAYRVVPILAATQCLGCVWHQVVNPLFLKKRTGTVAILTVVSAVISVGLALWLVPTWGVMGAALAPFVANAFINAAVLVIAQRVYPIPHRFDHLGLIVVAALLTFLVASLVPTTDMVVSIGLKTIALALYPALLLGLGLIKVAEIRRALAWAMIRLKR